MTIELFGFGLLAFLAMVYLTISWLEKRDKTNGTKPAL